MELHQTAQTKKKPCSQVFQKFLYAKVNVEFNGVSKYFPGSFWGQKIRAVSNVSFSVASGEIFALIGANGSGKTTALKIILGLIHSSVGNIKLGGKPVRSFRKKRQIGYLPDAPYFYPFLSGEELLDFYGRLRGLKNEELKQRKKFVLSMVEISQTNAARKIATFSKGMLQRIGLAQVLLHEPKLILLDEPTAGVDPKGVLEFSEILKRLKSQGLTIIWSSHYLKQVERLSDSFALLHKGRLVSSGKINSVPDLEGYYLSYLLRSSTFQSENNASCEK